MVRSKASHRMNATITKITMIKIIMTMIKGGVPSDTPHLKQGYPIL